MIDEREILKYNMEMAEHANGTAQFMSSLIGGQYATKELVCEAIDFLLASTKRNIESFPNATRQERCRDSSQRGSDEYAKATNGIVTYKYFYS